MTQMTACRDRIGHNVQDNVITEAMVSQGPGLPKAATSRMIDHMKVILKVDLAGIHIVDDSQAMTSRIDQRARIAGWRTKDEREKE